MSTIECSAIIELPSLCELMDIFESIITSQKKTLHQELTTMILYEDKLNDIPSSVVEISYQENQ